MQTKENWLTENYWFCTVTLNRFPKEIFCRPGEDEGADDGSRGIGGPERGEAGGLQHPRLGTGLPGQKGSAFELRG